MKYCYPRRTEKRLNGTTATLLRIKPICYRKKNAGNPYTGTTDKRKQYDFEKDKDWCTVRRRQDGGNQRNNAKCILTTTRHQRSYFYVMNLGMPSPVWRN